MDPSPLRRRLEFNSSPLASPLASPCRSTRHPGSPQRVTVEVPSGLGPDRSSWLTTHSGGRVSFTVPDGLNEGSLLEVPIPPRHEAIPTVQSNNASHNATTIDSCSQGIGTRVKTELEKAHDTERQLKARWAELQQMEMDLSLKQANNKTLMQAIRRKECALGIQTGAFELLGVDDDEGMGELTRSLVLNRPLSTQPTSPSPDVTSATIGSHRPISPSATIASLEPFGSTRGCQGPAQIKSEHIRSTEFPSSCISPLSAPIRHVEARFCGGNNGCVRSSEYARPASTIWLWPTAPQVPITARPYSTLPTGHGVLFAGFPQALPPFAMPSQR